MLSTSAFRYYKKNYDITGQFNRGLSNGRRKAMSVFFLLMYISGMSRIFRLIVKPKVLARKLDGETIVGFLFSINQDIIHSALAKLGLPFVAYNFISQETAHPKINHFPGKLVLLCSIANAKMVYRELKGAKGDEVLFNNSIRIVKLCGLELIYNMLLDNVKVIIQYNDHSPYSVLLHDVAESRGIKTVYIQHAPVSKRFPPLYHDLNVLFSPDSIEKYEVAKEAAKKFILFDVRFVAWDAFDNAAGQGVLICPNKLDGFEIVKDFARKLGETYRVTLRPHPADTRDWDGGDLYHVSRKTSIWDDIYRAKFVITNESAVILEAVYAGRLCYKCAFFSRSFDNYGFLKTGLLLQEYTDTAAVIADIQQQKVTYNRKIFAYFVGDIAAKEQKIKSLEYEILHLGG